MPVTPGGGSKSNVPAAALTLEIVPPAGVVVGPTEATEKLGVHPLTPESASVTPVRRPPRPVIFMFVCAAIALRLRDRRVVDRGDRDHEGLRRARVHAAVRGAAVVGDSQR